MRKSALLALGLVVTCLVALGLVVLYSAGVPNAERLYHNPYHFITRQAGFVVCGLVIAILAALFDYRNWRDYKGLVWLLVGIIFVLLCAVFLFQGTKGSHRWIPLGPINIQPSEFAKFGIVILLSYWLDGLGWKVELFKSGLLWPLTFLILLVAPVVLEPDFGSAAVILTAGFLIMFVAGVRMKHLVPPIILAAAIIAVFVALNPNRMARLASFMGETDASGKGYQAYNSLVAIANGGIWGVGLTQSMQKEAYLPEAHTDFIFAVGAEELGLIFSLVVLALFIAFYALSVYIARHASDRFGRFLVIGMSYIIFAQAMANIGVVCKAFPTKGVALPFFSYGGTNMISAFFAVGTIFSVGLHTAADRKRKVQHG